MMRVGIWNEDALSKIVDSSPAADRVLRLPRNGVLKMIFRLIYLDAIWRKQLIFTRGR